MMRALRTAATGMSAQQINLDTVANNLANVNTSGFKRTRIDFQDLMYQSLRVAGSPSQDRQNPTGLQVGLGVRAAATQKIFSQGLFEQTENPLDCVIEGDGFFQVTMPDSTLAYTRDGAFKRDSGGNLVTSEGYLIEPAVVIPPEATSISIAGDGTISAQLPNSSEPSQLGKLTLARFSNPAGLISQGKNLYTVSAASGQPVVSAPGTQGAGTITQGFLEKSNVSVVEEMVNMISAQRAYEVNSKVIQGADKMLEIASNLTR
ncbi:flagellar basal-body rod protein FlgG [bacterium]|nr:flagellar basal-body rod protein FlgG [bacterium]